MKYNIGNRGDFMLLKEVQKCTGLSKKALNYYEMKKLICVQKNESGYRDYSQKDIELLMKIKILRRLDFSIAEIEKILYGADNELTFNEHFANLDKKISQCNIQKSYMYQIKDELYKEDYSQQLYDIDQELESDFQQQELIHTEMKKIDTSISFLSILEMCIGFYLISREETVLINLGIWSFLHGIYAMRKSFSFFESPLDLMIYLSAQYIKERYSMLKKGKQKEV